MKHAPSAAPLLLLAFMPLLLGGCTLTTPPIEQERIPPAPQVSLQIIEKQLESIARLQKENDSLQIQLAAQRQLASKQQMNLLKKHAEYGDCQRNNQTLLDELIHSKAALRGTSNRLEAVTLLAEATAFADSIGANDLQPDQLARLSKVQQHLAEARTEFAKENYDGTAYLCSQIMEHLQRIDAEHGNRKQEDASGEISFFSPLQLSLVKNGNMRSAPSRESEIVAVIKADTQVTATGYRDVWVRVTDGHRHGWLHHSLLR